MPERVGSKVWADPHQELALLSEGQEALGEQQEPPLLQHGEVSEPSIQPSMTV
ncbi:MAG TPA: hypothetical protein VHZ51_29200 [Ktedonobacteraceae bacterium]|nr:hypothetical protein [Ktedonobacteraceae bacterium]